MVTVSVKQLLESIEEADVFKLPDMNAGTGYIYNSLYRRLTHGEDVRLSEIDYNAFGLDDIDTMRELYGCSKKTCKHETPSKMRKTMIYIG